MSLGVGTSVVELVKASSAATRYSVLTLAVVFFGLLALKLVKQKDRRLNLALMVSFGLIVAFIVASLFTHPSNPINGNCNAVATGNNATVSSDCGDKK